MPKQKTVFVCQQCGTESPKWMGKCPGCGEWNSMVEMVVPTARGGREERKEKSVPQKLSQIKSAAIARIKSGIGEFDRVLGGPSAPFDFAQGKSSGQGGIVPGSVVLVAGEPGIGKSTLMLQLAEKIRPIGPARPIILYVSGEESPQQIKIRAQRLGIKGDDILFLAETDVDGIINQIGQIGPISVIVDSIQTLTTQDLSGPAGSIGQVKECTSRLLKLAKMDGIPIFLIGHVTKEGAIAGPKVLEHMVDTVVFVEGEKSTSFRLLRTTKNRFGATDEVGVFEMTDKGMIEVTNPSRLFLSTRQKQVPGSVVVATIEGTRPVLVEIQALVVSTQLPLPRRVALGIDYNRLQLIIAVLTKRLNLPLGAFDIFVNIAGGLRIEEPAADLGVALAIFSSFKNFAFDPKAVVFGELGLLGEIRPVSQINQRIKEAKRLGFTKIISPENYSSINQAIKALI